MSKIEKLKSNFSGMMLPTAAKSKNRKIVIQYATLFAIKVADDFIQSKTNSNSIKSYISFLDEMCWAKLNEIKDKAKDGKWEINFGIDDTYTLKNHKAVIAMEEAVEKLTAINRFIKSAVRLFWDDRKDETDNLKYFIDWLPRYSAKL
jgi:hypothetical protein